jgi:co-chaperonin GroES (HSP10)
MTLEPKGNNVLLEIVSRGEMYAAGVKQRSGILVEGDKLKQAEPNTGIVYAIGLQVPADRMYKPGDTVIFKTTGIFQGFDFEGKKLVSVEPDDIVAMIDEAAL